MGSFNTQCAISKRNIGTGERIVRIYFRVKEIFKHNVFYHSNQFDYLEYFVPIRGVYDDYGCIEMDESQAKDIIIKSFPEAENEQDLSRNIDIRFMDIDEKIYDWIIKEPMFREYDDTKNWGEALEEFKNAFCSETQIMMMHFFNDIRGFLRAKHVDIVPDSVYEYFGINITEKKENNYKEDAANLLKSITDSNFEHKHKDALYKIYDLYEELIKFLRNMNVMNINITNSTYGTQGINHNVKNLYQLVIDNWPKENNE